MKNKHLLLNDRYKIETGLSQGLSFQKIGESITKNKTTISREIRNHYITKHTGSIGRKFNNCIHRSTCPNRGSKCIKSN